MVAFTQHDLLFILDGIVVSQTHADATNNIVNGVWLQSDIETSRQILRSLLPNSLEPIGMRTIDGELNNLEPAQDQFGATGNEFPRDTTPTFSDDGAVTGDGTGNPTDDDGSFFGLTNTDYSVSDGPSNTSGSDGNVIDSDPRTISNLIVDLSLGNPAAAAAAGIDLDDLAGTYDAGADGLIGTADDIGSETGALIIDPDAAVTAGDTELDGDEFFFIPNVAPDEGLSAPFNSWMTLFGQFFDHGLDLIQKGGSGTVFIPLADDDPLVLGADGVAGTADDLPEALRFMTLTRATVDPGEDGLLGTEDDVRQAENFTSPFVDQNQTYTSHPSHQLFVREYVTNTQGGVVDTQGATIPAGGPIATGALIEGASGGMATWGEVKAQAADLLGIELTDAEAIDIPLFAVDQYGEFLRGPNGLPQYVLSDGATTVLIEGDMNNPVSPAEAEALAGPGFEVQRTKFAFLIDIAHTAAPVFDATTGDLLPDGDDTAGNPIIPNPDGSLPVYDDELLDAHYIAGDGRANENIGLTAVHHVFHQEHNRLLEHTKQTLIDATNNIDLATVADPTGVQAALDLLNGYLLVPLTEFPAPGASIDDPSLVWNGDRLFQAAKFGTEMQYQHLVFEEFARKVQPLVDVFASFEPSIDPSITLEFSQAVYRFGHSMLTETVDLIDTDGNLTEVGLVEAFLNPLGFHQQILEDGTLPIDGLDAQDSAAVAGAIVRGMTRERGSDIDEFVTEALRNNLLGLPLDLASINMARARDVGIPKLNEVRAEFFAGTGDSKLAPYVSWVDFAFHSKNELSVINFIAAYGEHDLVINAETLEQKRAAAFTIVTGQTTSGVDVLGNAYEFTAADVPDRLDFLNSTGAWTAENSGLNNIDLWIGGLAEAIEPFGGMLGSTFNFVFEEMLEDLQDGDRFYYLGRTAGLNFVTQLEQNSFANMIIRNTDLGDEGGDHVSGDIFARVDYILEVDQALQFNDGLGEFVELAPTSIGEAGVMDFTDIPPDVVQRVDFAAPIANAVVALTLNTNNEADATALRVVSIDANGFEFVVEEFDSNFNIVSPGHAAETISWMAVEAGEHTLADGTVIKAGFTTADQSFGAGGAGDNTVTFDTPFADNPVVLAQVTGDDATAPEPVVAHVRSDSGVNTDAASTTGFQVRLREQQANAQDALASVGWIAIQQTLVDGSLAVGTVGQTDANQGAVDEDPANGAITFGVTVDNPVFLAHAQTQDGGDTFSVRGAGFDGAGATVFLQEETSADAEVNHSANIVGYVAVSAGQLIADPGVVAPQGADPVGDSIFFDLVIREDLDNDGDNDVLRFTGGEHVVLGGTAEDDVLEGGIGDDTLWGDGGDDRLEGGDGADILLGGDGDDIITDVGGEDNIQGQDGNDAIFSGEGLDLILAGAGKDFVLDGPGFGEVFGGQGDDFIHAGSESNTVFGGEGDDWLEGGGGNNLLQGDNGDPFLNSTISGHDVFISGQGDDDYDAEGGDDVMEGADGIQRFAGQNGFDWATYRDIPTGVEVDMLLRAFDVTPIPASNASILDRFAEVEGLSGGDFSDILRGSDQDLAIISGLNNGNDSMLRNFDLIQGLRAGDFGGAFDANAIFSADTTIWGDGDIILGGGGSDIIEGRAGDDIIDGDLKLDMRLLVRDPDTDAPIATAYEMYGELLAVDANGVPTGAPAPIGGFTTLQEAVFGGVVNPGDIHIVREIIDTSAPTDFDTAEFNDVRANYTIEADGLGNIGDDDGDGFIRITHIPPAGGGGGGGGGGNQIADGVDLVRNIERLTFADQTIDLVAGANTPATGSPQIVQPGTNSLVADPFVGQQLEATPGNIADADGLTLASFAFVWQVEQTLGLGDWEDLIVLTASGEDAPLQGTVITVPPEAEGLALRVRAIFQDDAGVFEQAFSNGTNVAAPAGAPDPTAGDDILLGTIGDDVINGGDGNDQISGLAGNDTLRGQNGDDILDGGTGDDLLVGGTGLDELFGNLGDDTLNGGGQADLLDGGPGNDTLNGGGGADELLGGDGDDNLNGNGGADDLFGDAGSDILRGNGGADTITGGTGDDFIFGGAGNDEILWTTGDGRDLVGGDGGAADVFDVTGDVATAETFRVYAVTPPNPDPGFGPLDPNTEIVITRETATEAEAVIAELRDIEELVINGVDAPAAGGAAADDQIVVIGDFTNTSLALATITINGSSGDDTVDISQLNSEHRIVFRSMGGHDVIVGALRPQDVIELAPGLTLADYSDPVYDPITGMWSITQIGGGHSVSWPGDATTPIPTLAIFENVPEEAPDSTDSTAGEDVTIDAADLGDGSDASDDDDGEDGDEDDQSQAASDDETQTLSAIAPLNLVGDADANALIGADGDDMLAGLGGDDTLLAGAGDDTVSGGDGADEMVGGAGSDIMFGGAGDDIMIAGAGDDMVFGGAGMDHVIAGDGDDMIEGGADRDIIDGGAGDDTVVATLDDGDDVYSGGAGVDTLDMSAITSDATIDLGSGAFGSARSAQSGVDTISGFENVVGGAGNDTIIANASANVMAGGLGDDSFVFGSVAAADGDHITDFAKGDTINLSGIAADHGLGGFTLTSGPTFTAAGQLIVRDDGGSLIVEGDVDGDLAADFAIKVSGVDQLDDSDFT